MAESVEIILAEFGRERQNIGGADLSGFSRVDPSYSSFRKHFPEALFTVYTDDPSLKVEGAQMIRIEPPKELDPSSPRYLWRVNNYYKVYGMLESQREIAIGIDSDMVIVSEQVRQLIPLTRKFGLCFPVSPRFQTLVDLKIGVDPNRISDEPIKYGAAFNTSPISLKTDDVRGREFLMKFLEVYRREPSRNNTVLQKTIWETGIYPYPLPHQWCVCRDHVGHKNIAGTEIILHVGQPEVMRYCLTQFFTPL